MPDADSISTTVVTVVDQQSRAVVCRLEAQRPDLALVDALARLQLDARRAGRRVCVTDASAALQDLLQLLGLADVFVGEPRGQAEGGEQLGVDEVVQPRDLHA